MLNTLGNNYTGDATPAHTHTDMQAVYFIHSARGFRDLLILRFISCGYTRFTRQNVSVWLGQLLCVCVDFYL